MSRIGFSAAIGFLLVAGLGGCAQRERAEAIFQRQNLVASALMEAIAAVEAEWPELAERLYDWEARLRDACGPLQDVALSRIDGGEVGLLRELAARDALAGCEAEARDLETMIRQVDPATADQYFGRPTVALGGDE